PLAVHDVLELGMAGHVVFRVWKDRRPHLAYARRPVTVMTRRCSGTGPASRAFHPQIRSAPMTADDAIYHAEGYADDDLHEADIVEWYEARPVTIPTAVAAGAIVTAFTLGALTAVGALFLIGRLDD